MVKTTESILNSDDIVYPFFIFRLFVFVLPKCVFLCSVLFFAQSITVVISIIFGIVVCQQCHVCPRNIPRTFRKMSTFNHETRGEHSARCRSRFIVPVSLYYQIYIFVSHYQMCVFIPHFVGVYVYAGTINRPLRLLTVCQNAANNLSIAQHSPMKHVANTPSGVGDRFIVSVFSHY